ncbi:MAG: hypothetical protein GPJ54_10355 [Candidatus Heimdallarchaeota archaeon]|nr:hypothetical protein [Candidatus Heimdallarchaeota archaeon]
MDQEEYSIIFISYLNGFFYFFYLLPDIYYPNNPVKLISQEITSNFLLIVFYTILYIKLGIIYHEKLSKKSNFVFIKGVLPAVLIIVAGIIYNYYLLAFVIGGEDDFIQTAFAFKILGFVLLLALMPLIIFTIPPILLFTLGIMISEFEISLLVKVEKKPTISLYPTPDQEKQRLYEISEDWQYVLNLREEN